MRCLPFLQLSSTATHFPFSPFPFLTSPFSSMGRPAWSWVLGLGSWSTSTSTSSRTKAQKAQKGGRGQFVIRSNLKMQRDLSLPSTRYQIQDTGNQMDQMGGMSNWRFATNSQMRGPSPGSFHPLLLPDGLFCRPCRFPAFALSHFRTFALSCQLYSTQCHGGAGRGRHDRARRGDPQPP